MRTTQSAIGRRAARDRAYWESTLFLPQAVIQFAQNANRPTFLVPREIGLQERVDQEDEEFGGMNHPPVRMQWLNRNDLYGTQNQWYKAYKEVQGAADECLLQFTALASAAADDHAPFLAFARRWGVLGVWPRLVWELDIGHNVVSYEEPLPLWRGLASHLRAILNIGAALHGGTTGDAEDWKAIYRDFSRSPYYRMRRQDFLTDAPVQKEALAGAVNDLLYKVAAHPRLKWGQGQQPSVELTAEYDSYTWDRDWLVDRRPRQDTFYWYQISQTMTWREQEELWRGMPYRPSQLLNVLVMQVAAILESPNSPPRCPDCGGIKTRKARGSKELLCENEECREKRETENTRLRMKRARDRKKGLE